MKHIALISLHTPTATNCRGASALPFHLLAFRPQNIRVEIWSFNLNGCSPEQIVAAETSLGLKIHIIDRPKWLRFLSPAPVRLLLSKPMLGYLPLPVGTCTEIKRFLSRSNSAIWIYGEDIAHLAGEFEGLPTVITTPDCEAMYYHRVLGMKGVPQSKMTVARYLLMYHQYARMAAKYPVGEKIVYHLVGNEDTLFLKKMNPAADAIFIRHPHYDLSSLPHAGVCAGEKIRLLVAGRYDFAMAHAVDDAVEALQSLPQSVKTAFVVTFLGKGWHGCVATLKSAGFDVQLKEYVEDYAAEVASHHIQLTPVAVGTGTKGKVLDAFANGLMVIGTPLALENIAVESGKECIEYKSGPELAHWLVRLAESPSMINEIASAGKAAVLSNHGRQKIADEFFSLFNSLQDCK